MDKVIKQEEVICGGIPMIMTIIDAPDYTNAPKTISPSASKFVYKYIPLNTETTKLKDGDEK